MPTSCTISRHGAIPEKPWRAAASTACGNFHCIRTVARLRDRLRGMAAPGISFRNNLDPYHGNRARLSTLSRQEVEIAALVGLSHPFHVEARVTARQLGGRPPCGAAFRQRGFIDLQVQATLAGIERNDVAVAYQRQRAASRGLR